MSKQLSICLKGLLNYSTGLSLLGYTKINTLPISQMQLICEKGQICDRIFKKSLSI